MFFSFCVKHYKYIVFIGTNIAKIVQFRRVAEQAGGKAHSKVQKFVRAFERDTEVSLCVIMLNIIWGFSVGVMGVKVGMRCDRRLCYRHLFPGCSIHTPRKTNWWEAWRRIVSLGNQAFCCKMNVVRLRAFRGPEHWSRENKPETI